MEEKVQFKVKGKAAGAVNISVAGVFTGSYSSSRRDPYEETILNWQKYLQPTGLFEIVVPPAEPPAEVVPQDGTKKPK